MRKYKKDIELPDFTGFENIHFYDYRFNKDVVENEDLRINLPNEVQ